LFGLRPGGGHHAVLPLRRWARFATLPGNGDTFGGLSEAERRRLRRQEAIMGLYSDVLDERIIAFS